MAVLGPVYFTNANQTDPGAFAQPWTNLNELLAFAGEAGVNLTSGFQSWDVQLDTPQGISIPAGLEITRIEVSINGYIAASGPSNETKLILNIAGGTNKQTPLLDDATPTTYTFFGDPVSYWGLTQQQALDFAAGTENLNFWATLEASSNYDCFVPWVEVKFWTTSPTVPLAALF